MKHAVTVLLTLTMLLGGIGAAQDAVDTRQAESAAGAWLALTDQGDGARSWEQASERFRARIDKTEWGRALSVVRQPLGNLKARVRRSAQFTRTLTGAPDGEYVVIQYDTQFDNKADAVETVTVMRAGGGLWKVAGYFIK